VLVVGVDGYRRGWVAVALRDARFDGASVHSTIGDVAQAFEAASVVSVDIPIGVPESGTRPADVAARRFLRPRSSSVFTTPTRSALEAPDYAAARAVAPSTSSQAYALGRKILEVDALAAADDRLYEVHPEVSFRALAGRLLPPKKSWNGVHVRRAVLAARGIRLPDDLDGAGGAPPDDVLDAAAAAWSALRIALGEAETLPRDDRGRIGPIWF
jgi:predicted RNase H-like nuclease